MLVRAIADLAAEGEWFAPIDAIVDRRRIRRAARRDDIRPRDRRRRPRGAGRAARRRHPRHRAGTGGTGRNDGALRGAHHVDAAHRRSPSWLTAPAGLQISVERHHLGQPCSTSSSRPPGRAGRAGARDRRRHRRGPARAAITAVVTSSGPPHRHRHRRRRPRERVRLHRLRGSRRHRSRASCIRITSGAGCRPGAPHLEQHRHDDRDRGRVGCPPHRRRHVRRSPATPRRSRTNELVGTVAAVSADNTTVTLTGVTLPTTRTAASAGRCCGSSARTARPPTARSRLEHRDNDHGRRRVGRRHVRAGRQPGLRRRARRRRRRPRQRPRPRRRHPRRRHHAGRRRHPTRRRCARGSQFGAMRHLHRAPDQGAGGRRDGHRQPQRDRVVHARHRRTELRSAERLPRAAAAVLERLGLGQPSSRSRSRAATGRPSAAILHPRDRRQP